MTASLQLEVIKQVRINVRICIDRRHWLAKCRVKYPPDIGLSATRDRFLPTTSAGDESNRYISPAVQRTSRVRDVRLLCVCSRPLLDLGYARLQRMRPTWAQFRGVNSGHPFCVRFLHCVSCRSEGADPEKGNLQPSYDAHFLPSKFQS